MADASRLAGQSAAPTTPLPFNLSLDDLPSGDLAHSEPAVPNLVLIEEPVDDVAAVPADVEAAIYAEIDRLKKDGVADWEIQKAKNTTRRNFINSMQSSLSRAINISVWSVYYNDPNLINTRLDKVSAVTKDDVMRVANKYLVPAYRTVVVTTPKKAAPMAGQ